jgi:hypothetical protein
MSMVRGGSTHNGLNEQGQNETFNAEAEELHGAVKTVGAVLRKECEMKVIIIKDGTNVTIYIDCPRAP